MNLSGSSANAKPRKGVVDKDYVAWVEKMPSVADGQMDKVPGEYGWVWITDGHHIRTKKTGHGDYWRIPLTRKQHKMCHDMGNSHVEKLHRIDFHEIVCKLLHARFGIEYPDIGDWRLAAELMVAEAEENFRNE